jgi:hypothetical protein
MVEFRFTEQSSVELKEKNALMGNFSIRSSSRETIKEGTFLLPSTSVQFLARAIEQECARLSTLSVCWYEAFCGEG